MGTPKQATDQRDDGGEPAALELQQRFSTPIFQHRATELRGSNAPLVQWILELAGRDPGVTVSNLGGWHSEGNIFTSGADPLQPLTRAIQRIGTQAFEALGATQTRAAVIEGLVRARRAEVGFLGDADAVARALLSTGAGRAPDAAFRPAELTRRVGTVDTFTAAPQVQLPTTSDLSMQARLTGSMMHYDWAINGRPYDQTVPLTIHEGQNATLTFANQTAMWHPMHLHGHTFQVIKADGSPGPRKDTVIVKPMQTVAVQLVADNPGVWMLHCHNGYHMDGGMMTTLNYTS